MSYASFNEIEIMKYNIIICLDKLTLYYCLMKTDRLRNSDHDSGTFELDYAKAT